MTNGQHNFFLNNNFQNCLYTSELMEIQTEHKSEISNIPIKGVGHGKGEFWERIDSSLPLK